MSLKLKDSKVTKRQIDRIKELLDYFEEVVVVTPDGSYFLHGLSPARGDDRLYIHGVKEEGRVHRVKELKEVPKDE
jgi:hypothetical protein